MKRLIILGAGGYGRTIADIARQMNCYSEVLFLDDGSEIAIGKCNDYQLFVGENTEFYPAFGNNTLRMTWIDKLLRENMAVASIVHPTAYISPTASVGVGTAILPKSIVNTDVQVGRGCIINCGAIIDHGCIIEDGCHICLGAIVKGENHITACSKIEAGEIIQLREYPIKEKE